MMADIKGITRWRQNISYGMHQRELKLQLARYCMPSIFYIFQVFQTNAVGRVETCKVLFSNHMYSIGNQQQSAAFNSNYQQCTADLPKYRSRGQSLLNLIVEVRSIVIIRSSSAASYAVYMDWTGGGTNSNVATVVWPLYTTDCSLWMCNCV